MIEISVADSIEAAQSDLTQLDHVARSTEWKRAALVFAFTKSDKGGRPSVGSQNAPTGKLSISEFAELGIPGLSSRNSVAHYRQRWEYLMEQYGAPEVEPGAHIAVPDVEWEPRNAPERKPDPRPRPDPKPVNRQPSRTPVPRPTPPPADPEPEPDPEPQPEPTAKQPEPQPEPEPEEPRYRNMGTMAKARWVAEIKHKEGNLPVAELMQRTGLTERNTRRMVPLGSMPEEAQRLIETDQVTMRAAELLSTFQAPPDQIIGLTRKVASGRLTDDRDVIREALSTFSMWPTDFREYFLNSDMTFSEAKEARAQKDAEAKERQRKIKEARRAANLMPKHQYGAAMMQRVVDLQGAFFDLKQHPDWITPDIRDGLVELVKDIIIQGREVLNAFEPQPDVEVVDVSDEAIGKRKFEIITGELA